MSICSIANTFLPNNSSASHLSQASVIDLTKNLEKASQDQADDSVIRSILKKLPIGGGNDTDAKISEADAMKEKSQAYEFNPDDVAPPEVQQQLWELLVWRDGVFREVVGMIEMVPGLESLIDSLTNALNACELIAAAAMSHFHFIDPSIFIRCLYCFGSLFNCMSILLFRIAPRIHVFPVAHPSTSHGRAKRREQGRHRFGRPVRGWHGSVKYRPQSHNLV